MSKIVSLNEDAIENLERLRKIHGIPYGKIIERFLPQDPAVAAYRMMNKLFSEMMLMAMAHRTEGPDGKPQPVPELISIVQRLRDLAQTAFTDPDPIVLRMILQTLNAARHGPLEGEVRQ